MPLRSERKAPRRRQPDVVNDASNQGDRARGEPLFHRPQHLLAPGRLNHDDPRRINPQMLQARRIKPPQLNRRLPRLAPQQCRSFSPLCTMRQPTQRKPKSKRQRRRPITRMTAARLCKSRFHLVQAINGKPACSQLFIDSTSPQSPMRLRHILIRI